MSVHNPCMLYGPSMAVCMRPYTQNAISVFPHFFFCWECDIANCLVCLCAHHSFSSAVLVRERENITCPAERGTSTASSQAGGRIQASIQATDQFTPPTGSTASSVRNKGLCIKGRESGGRGTLAIASTFPTLFHFIEPQDGFGS